MARIKVQVPGGNFKSIQVGGATTINTTVVQGARSVAPPAPSYPAASAGGVTSITGTTNEITASASTGDVTLSIADTYAGQTSITTLGTIGTGVWEGTAIGVDYGGVPSTEGVDSGWVLTNQSGTPEWEASSGGGGVTSISGTSNEIDVSASTGAVAISIDSGYLGQTSITTLGTIATGTWAGTAIAAIHGGTAQTSWTEGDILYASASNTLAKLAIGTTGEVLTVASGIPSWASAGGTGGTTETVLDQTGGASQSYSVPANTQWLRIICIGGGGGGGGGATITTTGNVGAGGGGASGCVSIYDMAAADAGSTLTVTFSSATGGAGGAGGASGFGGSNGAIGASVTVKDAAANVILFAAGGNFGSGAGTSSGGNGGTAVNQGNRFNGLAGAGGGSGGSPGSTTNLTAIGAYGGVNYGPTGGGGGGGTSGSTEAAGGTGGSGSGATGAVTVNGGAAGTAGTGSASGGTGGTGTSASVLAGAGGGGGGGGRGAYNGGNGGPGANYGGGGGGAGGCGTSTGGKGGTGGQGGYAACIIIAFGAASSSAGANPTGSIGLTAVNGSATTFTRSDSTHALSQAIVPTWTGAHTFSPASGTGVTINAPTSAVPAILIYGAANYPAGLIYGDSGSGTSYGLAIHAGSTTEYALYVASYAGTQLFQVNATGQTTAYEINFSAAAMKDVATYDSGSFTGTFSGMTTTTTGTVQWVRCGPLVTLTFPTITGTSNTDQMNMTGLPSALQTARSAMHTFSIINDGDSSLGAALVAASSGTITFYVGVTDVISSRVTFIATEFLNSGTKGMDTTSFTYSLI